MVDTTTNDAWQRQDDLIRSHEGLARSLARRYRMRGESFEDLEQVALVALVAAARRFDPDRGVPFPGYAAPCILGELKRHFRDRSWGMRVPRAVSELYLAARRARDDIVEVTGVAPTMPALAERLGCEVDELIEAMEAGRNLKLASVDRLRDEGPARLPEVDGGFEAVVDLDALRAAVGQLRPEQRELLYMRFQEGRTQSDIARRLGCSQMHVSRTLERIFTELRRAIAADRD